MDGWITSNNNFVDFFKLLEIYCSNFYIYSYFSGSSICSNGIVGKTINVISLAGIAFAVGMVVDAAIVVLENIYRLKERGEKLKYACLEGTLQVWQAVMVSVLTTVLVFIPILIMQLEAGQLLQDIAVAISVAVLMSLLVSVTILPALTGWILKNEKSKFLD